MEALLVEYAKRYGMEQAIKMLGLDQQSQNPKYTFGMPFTNKQISLDPLETLGRFGLNKVFSGGMSGIMGPAALIGGSLLLGRAFNPLNPNARNYSPNLKGQLDYLSGMTGMIGKDPGTGLMKYGPESVLAGQNVVSMFGTNNYQKQLDKKIDYFEDRIKKGKPYSKDKYEKAKKEKKDFFDYRADIRDAAKVKSSQPSFKRPTGQDIHGGGGGGNISGSVSRGGTDDTPGTPFRRGGIASL